MAAPTIQVTIGFPVTSNYSGYFTLDHSTLNGTDVLAGPSQIIDVSAYLVESLSWNRGRNRETDQFQCGSAQFVLRNDDRRFDPLNASGPYYPGILPRAPVAIYVDNQQVFGGYVDDYQMGYSMGIGATKDGKGYSTVTVSCVDAFSLLANTKINNRSLSLQTTGQRIAAVLALSEVNFTAAYNLATGTMNVQASTQDGVSALDHINTISASEGGWLYCDRSGALIFQDHNVWPLSAALWPNGVLTITDTGISYNGPVVSYDDVSMMSATQLLYNRVEGTRTGGVKQIVNDSTSQTQYLIRTLTLPSLELNTDTNVQGLCYLALARYKQPEVRFDTMSINLMAQDLSTQRNICALDIASVVMAERTPPGGGVITRRAMIEGISGSFDVSNDDYHITVQLADLTNGIVGLVLNDATYGLLDTDTLGLGDYPTSLAAGASQGGGGTVIHPLVVRG